MESRHVMFENLTRTMNIDQTVSRLQEYVLMDVSNYVEKVITIVENYVPYSREF